MSGAASELAAILHAFHERAPDGRKVAAIHLFGIEHHAALAGVSKHDVAELAGLPRSYGAELAKAAVLGEYVKIVKPLA